MLEDKMNDSEYRIHMDGPMEALAVFLDSYGAESYGKLYDYQLVTIATSKLKTLIKYMEAEGVSSETIEVIMSDVTIVYKD